DEALKIADDFVSVAALAKLNILRTDINVEVQPAPHRPPSSLPARMCAVYVFMHKDRCLKVGKAGPKSQARFCSQHYGTNAPSTLAKSLLKSDLFPELAQLGIKDWICQNTARINFFMPAAHGIFT